MEFRGRGRGRWRGRGRGGARWGHHDVDLPPIVRPIFDWSEVAQHFPQASPLLDTSLLTQLLANRVLEITPPDDEMAMVQGFGTKVATVIENMILAGDGEDLLLDEVRVVGSVTKGTSLKGNMVSDLVVLLKEIPTESMVHRVGYKVRGLLDSAEKEEKDAGEAKPEETKEENQSIHIRIVSPNMFELESVRDKTIARVYATTTGDLVYGPPHSKDMEPFKAALRMIRHVRWWEDHTAHLKDVGSLVRILKDTQQHVPGLARLNPWYIELIAHCAVIPLIGDEPLSLTDSFIRVWQLLSAGLFLPGSVGIPDPCEDSDNGVHETLSNAHTDELTRNSQRVLQMLHFGAYREVMAVDGATPIKFSETYSFSGVTLSTPQAVCEGED